MKPGLTRSWNALVDWLAGNSEDRRSMVKRLNEDRDELIQEFDLRYPRLKNGRPSEKVESVLTDICGFHVVDEPLVPGQLAVCDFSSRTVIVNSDMEQLAHHKTNVELLRLSTLAHELGHIRLHWEEMASGCSLHYLGDTGQFADSRSYQKEREADLYAGLFLVPLRELLEQRGVQNLLRSKIDKKQMSVGTLWNLVYREASRFKVSPTLMKRYFLEMRWVRQGPTRKSGLRELRVRF